MPTYEELYPTWDDDTFTLPGATIVQEQTCVSAFTAAREAVKKTGGQCPCCGQHVQVYRRNIYKTMAKVLVWLVAEYNRTKAWVRLKDGPIVRGGDNAKLTYWHLMVMDEGNEGYYKPTQIAIDFVARKLSLPRYAYVYDGKVQGYSEEKVSIEGCLDHDFDMTELGIEPWTAHGGS